MQRLLLSVGGTFALALVAACSGPALGDLAPADDAATVQSPDLAPGKTGSALGTADGARVIVVLRLRDERLLVHQGQDGPRFSVASTAGRSLDRDLTLDELGERHEHLWLLYRSGYASGAPYLDARLDEPHQSR